MNLTKPTLLLSISLFFFSCQQYNSSIKEMNNESYLVNGDDTVRLWQSALLPNLFENTDSTLHPKIKDGNYEFTYSKANSAIEGIYVNSKFYEAFSKEGGTVKRVSSTFDIIYIYPELRRYNYQIIQPSNYRIVNYLGFLYQDPSSRSNLPHFVKNIEKLSNNEVLLTYSDDSSISSAATVETLKLITFPKLKIELSDENLQGFQQSTEYIKLSKDVLNNITLNASSYDLPQDLTELYMREVVTKLVNIKYGTNYKTEEIIEVLN